MAIYQGISGIQIGDGTDNGNIALGIQHRVLRILYSGGFAYKTATIMNGAELKTGTVTFQKPEILQAEDYGTGGNAFQRLNSSLVSINLDIRRDVKYTYETFDISRLDESGNAAIDIIAASVASTIQNDLNSYFGSFVAKDFNSTDGTYKDQTINLSALNVDLNSIASATAPTTEDIRLAIYKLRLLYTKISKTGNKVALGVDKSELMLGFCPEASVMISQAYYNVPNSLSERVVAKDLTGYQFGSGMTFYEDKMLHTKIEAGTSFSKDTGLDTTGFVGFILHNESVGMPFNLNQVIPGRDQFSGNPTWICKYQFGIGGIRPELVYSITANAE